MNKLTTDTVRPTVLTIAGFDPSGGAGITADQRVIETMGCNCVSVATALTVQNTQGVSSLTLVEPGVLKAQLYSLFADITIDAVKIGMLGGHEQLDVVLCALRHFAPRNVVLDPVLASTGGVALFEGTAFRAFVTGLLPLVHLITPNLSEAARITGQPAFDVDTMTAAGNRLVHMGCRAAFVKGGHLKGDAVDVLVYEDGTVETFSLQRIATWHTHGTGCFLSSAIAAGLANKVPLSDAVREAKRALHVALAHPVLIGKGRGYPDARAVNAPSGVQAPSS